jgi:putative ABC transport system permease protein
MFKAFLKIAVRNFIKDKFFSVINVVGLSVGISVTLIITLFIIHELSYDNFHSKGDRIIRTGMHLDVSGNAGDLNSMFPPMKQALLDEVAEVEDAVRLYLLNGKIFKNGETLFTEDRVLFSDSSFFQVFDFKLLAGNDQTALEKPYQLVLTPALAEKYFKTTDWSDVIGKSISLDQHEYEITGIVEEAPVNSHIRYTAIANIESTSQGRDRTWDNVNVSMYVLLRPGVTSDVVLDRMRGILSKRLASFEKMKEQGIVMEPFAQQLRDIHLYSDVEGEFEPGGSPVTLYVFGTIACVVLLLASVNFVNLVTARSASRAKEVGVRKVLGSPRSYLMRQFIIESVILVAFATLIALGVVELVRTPFTYLYGQALPFDTLLSLEYLVYLTIFIIILGTAAGSYPAFFISSFQPAQVLKGKLQNSMRGGKLRNGLVSFQFVISMVLIACTLIVNRQLTFMRTKKLGFDKSNVVVINNANRLQSQEAYINAIQSSNNVELAGSSLFRSIDDYDGMTLFTEEDKQNRKSVNFSNVDYNYINVMKYELVAGRNFSRDFPSDSSAVLLNETAADRLFGGDAIGKRIDLGRKFTVVGVVRDFNFQSLRNEVRPLMFFCDTNQRFLHVRIKPGNYQSTIAALEAEWKKQTSNIPFSYAFLDETYDNLFKEEVRIGTIFSIFTGLALFIACLGLMGLAAYSAEQRKKEISVRKVLGANVMQLVVLMSKDFARIMVFALLIAIPLAYYIMNQWLESFVYKISIPLFVLFSGGVAVMVIALLAVSYQAIRAALVNPVESLKDE